MTITTAENDVKERLSIAYVTAVAARAGCELMEVHVDRNGVDGTIRAIKGTPVKIDVQLKATSSPTVEADHVLFDLDVATYNVLRTTVVQAPQLLVLLLLPDDSLQWLAGDELSLAFRKCAYWLNLYGEPETTNSTSIRVRLPRTQMFHPTALADLMQRAHAKAVAGQTLNAV
jgi:Domain of unknown function (DUF4365)